MADRLNEGYSDVSDNGGNKTLQGFELNRKIEGVELTAGFTFLDQILESCIQVDSAYKYSTQ